MSVPQFRDDCDWVQARVLREGRRDHLERVGIRLEAVRLHALERLRVL